MRLQIARITSLFLTGLIAGTFFYGTFCVLPAFYEVSSAIHLGFRTALMNHNKIVVMTLVLLAMLTIIFYCWEARKIKVARTLCALALIFTIISLVITRVGSVPINLQMKTWNPVSPPADWLTTLERWDLFNAIRTATSIGSFCCLLIVDVWLKKYLQNSIINNLKKIQRI